MTFSSLRGVFNVVHLFIFLKQICMVYYDIQYVYLPSFNNTKEVVGKSDQVF